jgi:quinol monooxygenase YgiN
VSRSTTAAGRRSQVDSSAFRSWSRRRRGAAAQARKPSTRGPGSDPSPASGLRAIRSGMVSLGTAVVTGLRWGMAEVQLVARYKIGVSQQGEVLALLAELIKATLAEPGCRSIEVYRRVDDDRYLAILARYTSREAFDAFRESEHFHHYVENGVERRIDSKSVHVYDVPPS